MLAFCLLVITSNGAFAQDAPTGLTATASPGQVTLSWTAANFPTEFSTINSPYAEFYRVYRSTTPGDEAGHQIAQVDNPNPGARNAKTPPSPLTTYTDTNVTPGTTYYYTVTAVLEIIHHGLLHPGDGPYPISVYETDMSNEANATPLALPVPTSLTLTPASAGVNVNGAQVFAASVNDQYGQPVTPQPLVAWSLSPAADAGSLNQSSEAYATYTAPGSAPTGVVTLTAVSGSLSATAAITVNATAALPAPAGVTATGVSSSQITLSWPAVTGATSYKIQRSPDGETGWAPLTTTTGLSISDTGLPPGTVFFYAVCATGSGGDSAYSDPVSAVTIAVQPLGLTAAPGDGTIALDWSGEDGGYSYTLYRGTTPGGEESTPLKTGINSTPFVDSGLTNGQTYYYQVSAVNDSGESVLSAEVSATPQAAPAPPPSQLTQAQAIALAQAFCTAIGAPVTATPTATWPAPNQTPSQQAYHWQPRWLIQFPGQAEVEVVDATGVISHFYNFGLSQQLLSANLPAGTPLSETTALSAANAVLTASGQPSSELASTPTDQNFQITDPPTQAGDLWMVTWARQFGSIPYRQEQATVMLQAETGAVQAFSLSFPAAPPSVGAGSVTSSQATTAAQALLTSAGVTATLQSATLQVVQPNTYWQAGGTVTPPANEAGQVAWDCLFTDANNVIYEVWVDSNTGGVIGGESYGIAGMRPRKLSFPARAAAGKAARQAKMQRFSLPARNAKPRAARMTTRKASSRTTRSRKQQ